MTLFPARPNRLLHLLIAACVAGAASPASADIYGYIEADGNAHFSTEKLDERYQLFMRGDASFDSAKLSAPAAEAAAPSALVNYLARHPNLQKYEALLAQAAKEFALEPALLKAVMATESAFNPAAVSAKGAIGLMQILPATAQRYGLQGDRRKSLEQKLADPKTNIRIGARYLRDLYRLFPSRPELVIASYNAGERAVQKYGNTIPPYPETRGYVRIVKQFYQLYKPEAQSVSILAMTDGAGAARRIHMTIPGRRNIPAASLE